MLHQRNAFAFLPTSTNTASFQLPPQLPLSFSTTFTHTLKHTHSRWKRPRSHSRTCPRCCQRKLPTATPAHITKARLELAASRRRLAALRALRADIESRRRLRLAARPPWVTLALSLCLVVLHVLAVRFALHTALVTATAAGGAVLLRAQPWRAITAALVHASAPHLALNVATLVPLGTATEIVYGAPAYGALLIGGAAAGAVGSAILRAGRTTYSVGASGALHALAAALIAHLVRNANALGRRQAATTAVALVAALAACTLGAAMTTSVRVDWIAHLGGFAAGVLLGAVMAPRMKRKGSMALVRRTRKWKAAIMAVLACGAAWIALACS